MALVTSQHNTALNLKSFYQQFGDKKDSFNSLDTLSFFDIYFEFFPKNSTIAKIFNSLTEFNTGDSSTHSTSIIEKFVQNITIPDIVCTGGDTVSTIIGNIPTHTLNLTSSNSCTIDILNTSIPIHEYLFYPWLREVQTPVWVYSADGFNNTMIDTWGAPYTTATITIDLRAHRNIQYKLYSARPTTISAPHLSQNQNGNSSRTVEFAFDFITVIGDTKNINYTNIKKAKNADTVWTGDTDEYPI